MAKDYPYDMCYIDQIQDKVDRERDRQQEGQRGTNRVRDYPAVANEYLRHVLH